MNALIMLMLAVVSSQSGAAVIDRIAVITGKHAIKLSDIDRDLRVASFLNRETLSITPDTKRKAAERLVDQTIIRQEIATGQYSRATDADTEAMLKQIRLERYGSSDVRLRQALSQYGLTEEQLKAQLLWQLTVLRFIDQRFRAGVIIQNEDIEKYYNEHQAELKREFPANSALKAVEPKIREILEGQQVNTEFEAWLDQERKDITVEYREAAFR